MKMNFIARHGLQSIVKTTTHRLVAAVLAICALLCLPAAHAQLYTGSIAGTVKDPSGAIVAGAQIRATDTEKGFEFSATSDSSGRYVIRQLPPANYVVVASASGFKTQRQDNVRIDVNQNASVDFSMAVGAFAEVVEVHAGAVELQTEDAETGQVINRRFINDLPLIDRNVLSLTSLAPGVTEMNDFCGQTDCLNTNFVSNGSRGASADFLLDGASATNSEPNGGITSVTYLPSPESTSFTAACTSFSATTASMRTTGSPTEMEIPFLRCAATITAVRLADLSSRTEPSSSSTMTTSPKTARARLRQAFPAMPCGQVISANFVLQKEARSTAPEYAVRTLVRFGIPGPGYSVTVRAASYAVPSFPSTTSPPTRVRAVPVVPPPTSPAI
ncbi:MAG: hypothetical protein DMG93_20065 [Acidobacteria bacterium]|nr:MAG: hypothetical protein DMG93_20065 [Acidobacteriota bacterium]